MRLIIAIALAVSTNAQDATLAGPSLGYVFDGGLRPLLGIPGAAVRGAPVDTSAPLISLTIAPRGAWGLGVRQDDGSLVRARLGSGMADPIAAMPRGRIDFSASGTTAVLWSPAVSTLTIVRGLPDDASAHDVEAGLPGLVAAVDDSGQMVLLGVQDDTGARLLRIDDGGVREIGRFTSISAVAFFPGSHDALVADASDRVVYLIHDGGDGATERLAGEADGVTDPAAIAATPDARRVLIANRDPGALLVVDLSDRSMQSVSCSCRPALLAPMNAESVYRLTTGVGGAPIWLADLTGVPRIVFVPGEAQP